MDKTTILNYKIAFRLAILTIGISILEGGFSVYFGSNSYNLTLFGFGIDSFIEVISGLGIAHMVLRIQQQPDSNRDKFEKTALRITGLSFYILAVGLVITSIYGLFTGHKPESGLSGIVVAFFSILLMTILIYGKKYVGKILQSKAILADAQCTLVCVYMSIIVLLSSGIYELTKFPFIDSIGTLGVAYLSYKEGKECFEKSSSNKDCGCEKC